MPIQVSITKSTNPKKKYTAVFSHHVEGKLKKIKTTHFGSGGMSDYTIHKDKARKELYLKRHAKREDWNKYMTAGSLSRYILWNKPSFNQSVTDYKKKFKLK
tara:strand:+ start:6729 stop:7034 length:306 start_codon:yes stop_codon:yes gene_type:complete